MSALPQDPAKQHALGYKAGVRDTLARLTDDPPGGDLRTVLARFLALEHGAELGAHVEEDQIDFDRKAGGALRDLAAALAPEETPAQRVSRAAGNALARFDAGVYGPTGEETER